MSKLKEALLSVSWGENINEFASDLDRQNRLNDAATIISIWGKQLEDSDMGNPAVCFIREMQVESQHALIALGLGIYKASAASMRAMVETALYYSFFRSHSAELETLVRSKEYYISKGDILAFHKIHTRDFVAMQNKLGLISKIEEWYSYSSSIIHGQIPGRWVTFDAISKVGLHEETLKDAVQMYCEASSIINNFFLCSVARSLWHTFQTDVKRKVLRGISVDFKSVAKLDAA
ncbi:hypothetical protein [Burkholderia sp. Tr-20390]|uniref:hypothetical protein n=1 Tax=Burkholderia sp. Tr-20390 TaxID=2703904 RepID=UPI00197F6E6A|nr:hypothetical protein [Burkholderia sp. Tr-20390]MBN3735404.1 hypothetical protein [Burkholderia sp. Tr-20390]